MAIKTNYEKNGKKYFRVTATLGRDENNNYIRKEFYGKSKREAEAKRDVYMASINAGLDVDYKKATLERFMWLWLFEVLHISDMKPSTFDRYEGIYRNYIKHSELSNMVLSDIKAIHVQRYYNKLYGEGKTPATIKNINKLLRYFLNYAIKEDLILKNPCYKITIPGTILEKETKTIEPFNNDEISRINTTIGEHIKMIFMFDLGTGLRAGELLALTIKDIDIENMVVTINKNIKLIKEINKDGTYQYKTVIQMPKTKSSIRKIPIPSKLMPDLKEYIRQQKEKYIGNGKIFDENSLLFTTSTCHHIDEVNMRKSFARVLENANVPYRNFHNVRHTYASKLFEAGVDLKTVSSMLGHANINITANTYDCVKYGAKNF